MWTVAAMVGGLPFVQVALAGLCQGRIRGGIGAFPEDLEIDDGYPSDARVEEIGLVCVLDARRWLRDVMPSAINALPCGHAEVEPSTEYGQPSVRITVTTGGWSGVESVVYAVLDHPIMRRCLVERRRGGLYVFEVPGA